ncbi:NAD(P)H-binding protein [Devosia sp. A8/3-2]|nr:NAD(P)H-binding protein [Devosia sp. A8/3-2]
MSTAKITVLGINGHIGHHAAKAFRDAGYSVTGFGRSNRMPIEGVTFVKGDAGNVAEIAAAIADADIVVNALNLPYDKWDKGRAEAQLAVVIAAMGDSGKTMMFPGNVYNYAAIDRRMTPTWPSIRRRHAAPFGCGRRRCWRWHPRPASSRPSSSAPAIFMRRAMLATGSTEAMLMDAKKGKVYYMADLDVGHAWAYLPDLGRAFVAVAEQRQSLGGFETFHFAGHYETHGAMLAAIQAAAPALLKAAQLPRIMLQAMGLAMPMMREIVKMRYLWNNPMELVDARLDAILGKEFGTPFAEAVAAATVPFFADRAA